jgi:aspartate-semialdehyde dehydrogenase
MSAGLRVAVVGATGAVGTVMLRLLRERGFPASEIVPFASERSVGRELEGGLVVAPLDDETIQGFDVALFSAGATRSREWAHRFVDAGAVVVDNSSAFRREDAVPLVVSEVNPAALERHNGIVANPNCTTMVAMLPLKALHDAFNLRAMVATSFQAAGGAGQKGIDELAEQIAPLAADVQQLCDDGATAAAKVEHEVHAATLAFNVVPQLGTIGEEGYTDEELKLRDESRKILSIPDLAVSPTCVRVPVMVGHGVAVRATFATEVDLDHALDVLRAFPNLVLDDVPTPLAYAGRDEVAVGRIRRDLADPHALNFFVVGDNLLKGAALNTVQLAEALHERGLIGARV